jgi:hypothetical protein
MRICRRAAARGRRVLYRGTGGLRRAGRRCAVRLYIHHRRGRRALLARSQSQSERCQGKSRDNSVSGLIHWLKAPSATRTSSNPAVPAKLQARNWPCAPNFTCYSGRITKDMRLRIAILAVLIRTPTRKPSGPLRASVTPQAATPVIRAKKAAGPPISPKPTATCSNASAA